ncbi:retrovirus-related pol polyprotein from transposon 297 family protein [Tanacetum coccineum]
MGAPSNEEVNGVYENRPRNDPFSENYNPGWRNHLNFRWKDDDNYNRPNNTQQQNHGYKPRYEGGDSSNLQQNYQQQNSYQQRPQQYQNHDQGSSNGQQSNVEQKFDLILSVLAKSNQGANLKFESLSKSVMNLERQMGQLAEEVHKREEGKLPSYLTLNPKHKPSGPEHVNMVTSLRNGKTYNNDIKIPSVHDFSHDVEDFVTNDEIVVEGKKVDNVKSDSELVNDLLQDVRKPPTQNPKATESPKVGEGGLSSTTTPYLAALEKSASARLAKKGPRSEDIAVLSSSLPPKFKDLRAPLISIMVGNIAIKRDLLDLGASINILPASLVDKYDLGTLRKTDTIISLADRSTKIPKGILEDVIVKVYDFYYPVDFFVMDTESPYQDVQPTIILGRPFLATIDARINCRTGAMDIAFGNRKLRLNVFNLLNSPTSNDCYHIDTIDERIQTHTPSMNLDHTLENFHCADSKKELFDGMTFHEREEEF